MRLKIGDAAPAFEIEDSRGRINQVPEDFKGKRLVLVFLRHLGCPLCMRRIDELKNDFQMFQDVGVELMIFVQSTPARARSYAEKKELPFALASDREKKVYNLYGVDRGGLGAFLAPRVIKATAQATLKGYMHGAFDGDELQKPAEFIIGPDGKIAWFHYGEDISDVSSSETIFKVLNPK